MSAESPPVQRRASIVTALILTGGFPKGQWFPRDQCCHSRCTALSANIVCPDAIRHKGKPPPQVISEQMGGTVLNVAAGRARSPWHFGEARKGIPVAKFNGINHLALATGDMDTTVRFWRDLLGMRLVAGLGRPGYRHYFFEISERDMVAFFEWEGVNPLPEKDHGAPVSGPFGFDHVSFGVDTEDDLWELKDKLDAAGFWVSEVVDHGFILSIYTFDPNNIPLEFSLSTRGKEIRTSPLMADSQPSQVTQEGSEPQRQYWPQVEAPTARDERRSFPGAGSELFHQKMQT